jgi:hypothetical protein
MAVVPEKSFWRKTPSDLIYRRSFEICNTAEDGGPDTRRTPRGRRAASLAIALTYRFSALTKVLARTRSRRAGVSSHHWATPSSK